MPVTNGVYTNPGWVNGSAPYINATELNAISDTLENVPIANGGTGATTASAACTNIGAVPLSNVTSKGSAAVPVYFDSNGIAQEIQVYHETLSGDLVGDIYKIGKVVMVTAITAATYNTSATISSIIPSGYRPIQPVYDCMIATAQSNPGAWVHNIGEVYISTSGTVMLIAAEYTETLYYRFTVTYLTA